MLRHGGAQRRCPQFTALNSAVVRAAASQGGPAQAAAAAVPSAAGAPPAEEYIEIGIIRSAHGLRGEMKVESLTSTPKERLGCPGPRCRPATCLGEGRAKMRCYNGCPCACAQAHILIPFSSKRRALLHPVLTAERCLADGCKMGL